MIAWLKKLLYDETAFVRWFRGIGFALAAMIASGQIPDAPAWLGAVAAGISGLMGAGDKNPPGEK